jgi:ribonuclease G
LAEWLYEEGIGENRAILAEGGAILEAAIELPNQLRAGSVIPAKLAKIVVPGCRGLVELDGGEQGVIEPLPPGLSDGAAFNAEVVREPIPETGRPKPARVRASNDSPRPGQGLKDRIGRCVTILAVGSDRFEEAGWSELLEEARTGAIPFTGGALRMSLTPAMTLFDVDGTLPLAELAEAGAAAAAKAVRRFGIGGSIGIDLPTVPDRSARQAAAAAVDSHLPPPFERTAVNGFGFLQIVRRRDRPSIPEIVRNDPAGAAARALLRQAERCGGPGRIVLAAHPAVVTHIEGRPEWVEKLQQRSGAPVVLQAEAGLAISAGHVHRKNV